jgi:hypothetical protein
MAISIRGMRERQPGVITTRPTTVKTRKKGAIRSRFIYIIEL